MTASEPLGMPRSWQPTQWEDKLTAIDGVYTEEAGDGGVVVLVHGQPGSSGDWDLVGTRLSRQARLIRYDRPGWGRSRRRACGIWENSDVLAEIVNRLAMRPVVIVGYSFGAAVAVAMTQRHAHLVRSLVLVNPAITCSSLSSMDKVLATPALGDVLALSGFALGGRALSVLDRHGARLPGALRARLGPFAGAGLGDALRGEGRPWAAFATEQRALLTELASVEEGLSDIVRPVSVIGGERDRVVPPAALQELCHKLPSVDLTWLSGGHLLPWSAPGSVAKVINQAASE